MPYSEAVARLCMWIRRKRFDLHTSTVKEFLTAKTANSDFAVSKADGHRRLAMVCLDYLIIKSKPTPRAKQLSSDEGGRDRSSRRRSSTTSTSPNYIPDAFTEYASTFLFSHLMHGHSTDEDVSVKLAKFLGSISVLRWIEYIAANGNLQTVFQAGKIISSMLARRAQHSSPIGLANRQIAMLEKWGDDLVHLVTKYARRLRDTLLAIHHLIPPFCPPDSAIRQQFPRAFRSCMGRLPHYHYVRLGCEAECYCWRSRAVCSRHDDPGREGHSLR